MLEGNGFAFPVGPACAPLSGGSSPRPLSTPFATSRPAERPPGTGQAATDPIADIRECRSTLPMRVPTFLCLLLVACSPNSEEVGNQQHYRGLVDVGPHGPVYTSSEVLKRTVGEFVPWQMSGTKLDPAAYGQALGGTSLKVEFRGHEVPVTSNGDGFSREVFVTEWISVQPCTTGAGWLRECLEE